MNPQTVTILSGVVLLLVFAVVGRRLRRGPNRRRDDGADGGVDP